MKHIIKPLLLSLFMVLFFLNTVSADRIGMISEPTRMALLGLGLLGIADFSKRASET